MRRRGKRELAALLTVALLAGSAACGADAGEKDAATGTAEAAAGQDTETAAGQGTDAQAGAQENLEETALSLMREVNPAEAAGTDDLYRSWYEVFVYSFYDGDGDGIGDLPGLTEKLDYINDGNPATDTDLGCDGIWLMPVMPATTYHKYDVTDYCAIDEQYGTMEDFETFVNACHERGIRVMIDFVMNHTSSQHPWFQTAAEYLKDLPEGMEPDTEACPYVDYYHFSREKGSGYCQLAGTDWYYEAQFWSEMPDLNLESEAVRQEFDEITDFWLEKGVDGFRLDAAKEYETGSIDSNIEILSWFNNMVKEKKSDAYIVTEVWSDLETYAQYVSRSDHTSVTIYASLFFSFTILLNQDRISMFESMLPVSYSFAASSRKPSTPFSSQKSVISSNSCRTASLSRFRSGISLQNCAS